MTVPKVNKQSVGNLVAQFFDDADPFGATVDETSLIRMFGARYTWVRDSDGIHILQTVANTHGPVHGLFPWPAKGPRKLAQLSWVFAAKIVSTSPLKARPIKTGSGSGWDEESTLEDLEVFTPTGAAPANGAFGLVVIGTELKAQKPLFFEGGGSAMKVYKITSNTGGGNYTVTEYDYPGGTAQGSAVNGHEMNSSSAVPNNHYVFGSLKANGKVEFYAPFGC